MPTTLNRKPRRRPSPSHRDQEIYLAWSVSGKTQQGLAADHKLTQCRISQIIRRVAAWRANLSVGCVERSATHQPTGERSDLEQQRLNRWLEQQRLELIVREAIRHFHTEQRTIKSTTTTQQATATHQQASGGRQPPETDPASITRVTTTETTRELPASVQWLKTALRAVEQIAKIESRKPLPAPKLDNHAREQIMWDELTRRREEAEAKGDVVATEEPWQFTEVVVGAFLGEEPYASHSEDHEPALRQLTTLLNPNSTATDDLVGCVERSATHHPSDDDLSNDSSSLPSENRELKTENPLPSPTSSTSASDPNSSQPSSPQHLPPEPFSQNSSVPTTQYPVPPSPTPPLAPSPSSPTPTRNVSEGPPPKAKNPKLKTSPTPDSSLLTPNERRLAHEEKLRQLAEYRRRGLPCMFTFDPADGPLPPPSSPPHGYHAVEPGIY